MLRFFNTHNTRGRNIASFKGEAAIIGCTQTHPLCDRRHLHSDQASFYSIDMNKDQRPDMVLNITEELPRILLERFQFTHLENVDYAAYNENTLRPRSDGAKGFQNLLAMTKANGFIYIVGCPRQKEYRLELAKRGMVYIELVALPFHEENENILIPMNQNADIEEIMAAFHSLPKEIQEYVKTTSVWPERIELTKIPVSDLFDYRQLDAQRRMTHTSPPEPSLINIPRSNINLGST